MLNNINVSNLQVFNKEGASLLPCSSDSQEAIQAAIAKKVGKLLNAEGFLTLIPDFDPLKDTKLRIHLTKDGITIQLLERDSGESKVDSSYTKKDPELSEEIKTRKEKIIKKIDLLFKEPSSPDLSTRLESEKIHPLFIPSQPDKNEQSPFRIGFDATVSNPQIQQLHTKIEGLQDQLNKKTPHSEELQIIKEQLQFLNQAIHNLSRKQENITYPHSEEYVLIHKLVDNQQDIYRALLDLLSRNLNQIPITQLTPSPAQKIENSALKEMLFDLQQEKTALEETRDALNKSNATLQEKLLSKEQQITTLNQQIQGLPTNEALQKLQSELDKLQSEKAHLQLQQDALNKSNATLNQQIQGLPTNETLQELQSQLGKLQSEKAHLQLQQDALNKSNATLNQQIQGLPTNETLQELQSQLGKLQSEKAHLQSQQAALSSQLDKALQTRDALNKSNATLQEKLLSKEQQITTLNQQIQGLPTNETLQELQSQLGKLQSEKAHLQSQQAALSSQLDKALQTRDALNKSNATLQEKLLSKEQQITTLNQQIQGLPTNEALQKLQSQLGKLQSEKAHLQSQQAALSSQLDKALQTRDALNKSNATLQEKLLSKEQQITTLNQQIQGLPTNEALQKLQSELDKLQSEKAHLQLQQDVKDKQILELNEETQRLSQAYQVLQNQLENEKEMLSIIEIATISEVSKEIASIDTIIEESEKAREEALSSLENSTTSASLLSPSSVYYTLTTMPSLEESSLESSSETTLLQAQINALQEELKEIRPDAYNTTNIIEKMKKSNEDLTLALSEKTKTIENLEEEKKFLESQLDRSKSQVKTVQHQLKKQQKEISVSSDENNDLLEELEKIQRQLSSEKRERAQLEQIYQEQLEKLGVLYDKNVLEGRERINAKIFNLQQQQKNICFTLIRDLARYVESECISEEIGRNILDLVEKAFYTTGYKTLLDLISSEEEDFVPSERNVSSDEYNEDSYL